MENFFPYLLTYSFFSSLVLRAVLALVFFNEARQYFFREKRAWLPLLVSFFIGALLVVGYATQLVAMVGLVYIAFFQFKKQDGSLFSVKTTAALGAAIFVSLLLSGAGGFAFDLPF